jgi:beta-N-acetylhexosaminidase
MSVDLTIAPFWLDTAGERWVDVTLAAMTLDQKLSQILCPYLRSRDVGEWTAWLDDRGLEPGAMMLTARPVEDAERDVRALQAWSRVPLLVSGNLESGAVNFLEGTEAFANPMQVAATGDPAFARLLAQHCIRIADRVGVNWAFAPVVDIAVNPANPITNTRTFGRSAELVAELGAAYIAELESRGIATSAKHFPGDGVDDRDQHLVTSSNDLDEDLWWAQYGAVYRRAIAAGTRTIMAGHIRQPALSRRLLPGIAPSDIMPATLAPELLGGVLRKELGFNGLIVTDNSAMTGFTSVLPRAEALPRAIAAGVDMILGNIDIETDFRILQRAAAAGTIEPDRLDDAVRRVLAVKASIGLPETTDRSTRNRPDAEEENGWRAELARRSITVVKDTQALLPLRPDRHRRALVYVLGDEPTFYDPSPACAPRFVTGLRERGLEVEVRQVPGNSATPAEAEHLHERFDVCIYFADLRFTGNANLLRVRWSPSQGADAPRHVATLPTVLVSVADPYLLQDLPMIRTALNGYTPTPATVDASLQVLFGEIDAVGRSPVDPYAGHWDAAL